MLLLSIPKLDPRQEFLNPNPHHQVSVDCSKPKRMEGKGRTSRKNICHIARTHTEHCINLVSDPIFAKTNARLSVKIKGISGIEDELLRNDDAGIPCFGGVYLRTYTPSYFSGNC